MKGETLTKAGHTKREGSDVLPSLSLPVCHSSNSSCAESTNNCSGHGFCFKKYATKGDEAYNECYACKCQETVEKKEDGTTRKVRWGGPACQKQDLSSPFWLLAGITIMVVGAAAAAVGMLFNVGQEELPGVISAGVGAPRGQK